MAMDNAGIKSHITTNWGDLTKGEVFELVDLAERIGQLPSAQRTLLLNFDEAVDDEAEATSTIIQRFPEVLTDIFDDFDGEAASATVSDVYS